MITQQCAIVAAIIAALKTAPALAGGNVYEDDDLDGLPTDVDQAITVTELRSERTPNMLGAQVQCITSLRITTVVRGDLRTADGRPSRLLQNDVLERLSADPSLGGLVMDLQLRALEPADPQRWEARVGGVDALYVAEHRSAWNTLT